MRRAASRDLMALLNISVWRYVNRIGRKRDRARRKGGEWERDKHSGGRAGYGIP